MLKQQTRSKRIEYGCFCWIQLFGNYDRAIAFLFRIVKNLFSENQNKFKISHSLFLKAYSNLNIGLDYTDSDPKYILDLILYRLEEEILDDWRWSDYRIYSSLIRSDYETDCYYCHWFEIEGDRFWVKTKVNSLNYTFISFRENYTCLTTEIISDRLTSTDRQLLYQLTGWKNLFEVLEGLMELFFEKDQYYCSSSDSSWLKVFSLQKNSFYPSPSDLFSFQTRIEHLQLLAEFKLRVRHTRERISSDCPLRYICSEMATVRNKGCDNYDTCYSTSRNIFL